MKAVIMNLDNNFSVASFKQWSDDFIECVERSKSSGVDSNEEDSDANLSLMEQVSADWKGDFRSTVFANNLSVSPCVCVCVCVCPFLVY